RGADRAVQAWTAGSWPCASMSWVRFGRPAEASLDNWRPSRRLLSMQGDVVLVVDDEPQIRRVVRNVLTPENARVIAAANGRDAIDLAAAERPALIVLDLGLPDITGLEVCREIRGWSSAPI